MESCELRLVLDELTDVGGCSAGSRCCRRTSAGSRSDRPGRRGSAMAALLKAPAFRQYSGDVKDLRFMSRQNLVEVLRANLVNAATHDFSAYVDSCQQLGISTRRYFSHDRDVMMTSSSEEDSCYVINHLLRDCDAWKLNNHLTFRMPTFAEFVAEGVAERRRNRSTLGTDDRRSDLKVSQVQRQHSEVTVGHLDVGVIINSISRPSKICINNTVR